MLFVSAVLVILGAAVALTGERLFRAVLPLVGLVAGFMVGWSGVEAIFGINALSIPVALITGLLVGSITAVLSYLYFSIAVTILVTILFGYGAMYLGLALGLAENSFLLTMLAIAGWVIGLAIALNTPVEQRLVVLLTSFYGVAMILVGIMMVAGHVSVEQFHENGVVKTALSSIENHFIWLLVWIGGSLIASLLQDTAARYSNLDNQLAFSPSQPAKQKKQ